MGKKKDEENRGMPGPMKMMSKMMGKMMGGGEDTEAMPATDSKATETPLQILNRRLANGEITKEEYLDMKELLSD